MNPCRAMMIYATTKSFLLTFGMFFISSRNLITCAVFSFMVMWFTISFMARRVPMRELTKLDLEDNSESFQNYYLGRR